MPDPTDLLTPDEVAVLTRPDRWLLAPGQVPTVRDDVHARWLADNSHAHAYPAMLIWVSGGGLHARGEDIYACTPGTLLCFDPFDHHDVEPAPHLPACCQLWFGLHGGSATARLIEVRDGRWRRRWGYVLGESQDTIRAWRHAIETRDESEAGDAVRALRLRAVAELLSATLLEGAYSSDEFNDRGAFGRTVVAAICEHLEATAGRGEDLTSLARLAGYSKFHFARLFKEYAGMTVHEYTDVCRLNRTRELIAQGATQAEVADALGFSSAQSFCRWYRRYR